MKEKNDNTRGYLKKLKTSSLGRIFGSTNLRWFECNSLTKQFGYKEGSTDKDFIQYIWLKEITDYSENLSEEEKNLCEWKYGFKVVSPKKTYSLYAQSQGERTKWKKLFDVVLNRVILTTQPKTEIKPISPLPKRKDPPIDHDELERQKKIKEDEEMRKLRALELERIYNERERESKMKKGFYEDIAVLVETYDKNVDSNQLDVKSLKFKNESKLNISKYKYTNDSEKFTMNGDEVDDWNYYGLDGSMIMDDSQIKKPTFIKKINTKEVKKERVFNYDNFRKNLVLENILNDHSAQEKNRKNFEEEQKKIDKVAEIKKKMEEEEQRKTIKLEKELKTIEEEKLKEKEQSNLTVIQRIKFEIDQKRSLIEKYVPNIDPERGTKFSIYENVLYDKNGKKINSVVNYKFEGVDLTTRANPKHLKNELFQPYNTVGNNVGIQLNSFKPNPNSVEISNNTMDKKKSSKNKDESNIDIDHRNENIKQINRASVTTKIIPLFIDFMDDMRDFDQNYNSPLPAIESNYIAPKQVILSDSQKRETIRSQKLVSSDSIIIPNQSNKPLGNEFSEKWKEKMSPKNNDSPNKSKGKYSRTLRDPKANIINDDKSKILTSHNRSMTKIENINKSHIQIEKPKKENASSPEKLKNIEIKSVQVLVKENDIKFDTIPNNKIKNENTEINKK